MILFFYPLDFTFVCPTGLFWYSIIICICKLKCGWNWVLLIIVVLYPMLILCAEITAFSDRYSEFEKINTEVLGVSIDSVVSFFSIEDSIIHFGFLCFVNAFPSSSLSMCLCLFPCWFHISLQGICCIQITPWSWVRLGNKVFFFLYKKNHGVYDALRFGVVWIFVHQLTRLDIYRMHTFFFGVLLVCCFV